jgi:Na+/H+ antiporter NhaD/arsenite permease-like protein
VLELARDRAPIGLLEYCRTGIPVTLATLALGTAALALV